MVVRKIAFCGAPLAGKTTLLQAIAKLTNSHQIGTIFGQTENTTRLDVSLDDYTLMCVTISGVFYHHQRSGILTKLLDQADLIVYICSTVPPKNAEPKYFKLYAEEAAELQVAWTDIPWLFVLTNRDLSNDNPLQHFIPPQFHAQILRCSAPQGSGVTELWQRIVSTIA